MYCQNCHDRILPREEVVVLHAIATEPRDSEGPYQDESVEWVGHGCYENGSAVPLATGKITPGLGDVLLADEVDLLERARLGLLPCPSCQAPLGAEFLYHETLYAGVRLYCLSCGFEEY